MRGQSSSNNVPAKHRIGLAVSIAFLAHTLIFSGLPSPILDVDEPQHTIEFELVFPESRASASEAARMTTVEKVIEARNPAFEIPSAPEAVSSSLQVTAEVSDQKTPERELAPRLKPQKTVTDSQGSQPSATSITTPETKSSQRIEAHPAHQSTVHEIQKEEQLTRITQSPTEQDPYLIKLAIHLGRELEKLRVPAIGQLSQKVTMEIELQLLANGALTRAKILKPTGIKGIDEAIYRASLAASPYPKPPEDDNQNRFEVELLFSPKRL